MNRVVLIQPPIRDFYLTRKRTLPYGLASIAASLEKAGFDVTIIDGLATDKSRTLTRPKAFDYLDPYYGRTDISLFSLFSAFRHFGYSHEHLGQLCRQQDPFVVGISSLFTPYSDQPMAVAEAIKTFCPGAWVVLGGHHPTVFPGQCLESPHVDFVVRGEAETAFTALCRFLENNGFRADSSVCKDGPPDVPEMRAIPGLAFQGKDGLVINDPAWEKDLDALPVPAIEKTRETFYRRGAAKAVTIAASRGCPFGCSYCSVSSRSGHGRFRRRSVDHVLAEIRSQADRETIGFIDFEDENLTLDKAWILELLSGIQQIFGSTPVELRAMNGLFPPSLDREILAAMKMAGFKTLNLSVGTFSGSGLKRFGRPDVRKSYETVLAIARDMGMETVSYIIGASPNQTARDTLDDLLTLAGHPTLIGLSIFYPAPGSVDYARCREQNVLPDRFEKMRSSALPLDHTTRRLESITLLRLSRMINFMKSLADTRHSLPHSHPFEAADAAVLSAQVAQGPVSPGLRFDVSIRLLQWFLHDGRIRGMDRTGQIYDHTIDADLCQRCITGLKSLNFMGVLTGPWSMAAD